MTFPRQKQRNKIDSIKTIKTSQGEVRSLASFRIFKLELARLFRLYENSLHSYITTREYVYNKIKSGELKPDDPILFKSFDGKDLKILRAQTSAHNLRTQHPRYLRELIFVRIISALEILLVDLIEEVFMINKNVYKSTEESKFNVNETEFLSYKTIEEARRIYIEKKCRDLHSQGYEIIQKFYFRNLGIDINKSGAKNIILYHNQRHLLVHRLGKTDLQYRHKYNTEQKTITIEEEWLLECSRNINCLAFYVNQELIKSIDSLGGQ